MPNLSSTPWQRRHWQILAILAVTYALAHLLTVSHYGVTWDAGELYVGDKNLRFYLTLDPTCLDYTHDNRLPLYQRTDHPDFYAVSTQLYANAVNRHPWEIWPLGATSTSITKHLFYGWLGWYDPIDAHHLVLVLYGLGLVVTLFLLAAPHAGRWGAMVAVIAFVAHPRIWAHLHNNYRDVPLILFFAVTIAAFYRGLLHRKSAWLIVSALAWGAAMAAKANALLLPPILIPWAAWILWRRHRRGQTLTTRSEVLALVAYPLIGLAVMCLLWPYLLLDFPLNLGRYAASLTQRGFSTDATGWQWLPLANAVITTPPPLLILLLAGLARMAWLAVKRRSVHPLHPLLAAWLIVPVLRVMLPGTQDFDVIRHWLEFLPAAAIIAGIGAHWLLKTALLAARKRKLRIATWPALAPLAIVLWFSPVLGWMAVYHPHELAYYNCLVGGLKGAQARGLPQATDYWGSSYRQGIAWLNANAPENSLVIVGVAEHLFFYSPWLRPDLRICFNGRRPPPEMLEIVRQYPGAVYLIAITRRDSYSPFLQGIDRAAEPTWDIRVDGAPILKLWKLKGAAQPAPEKSENPQVP